MYRRKRLRPGRRQQLAVPPYPRRAQPVRIDVEVPERGALRADEAPAERVGVVAPDTDDRAAVQGEFQPAGRLAQRAGAVRGLGHRVMQAGGRAAGNAGTTTTRWETAD